MKSHKKVPWIETPLIRSATLSNVAGCNVYLKMESLQPSGSFKSQGIGHFLTAKLASIRAGSNSDAAGPVHFYSSSGGNAGLGCVHGTVTLGCKATVVVPLTTTDCMVSKLRQAGAVAVVRHGESWQEADEHLVGTVMPEAQQSGETAVYVPPFDAPEIWEGNALIAHETVSQLWDASRHYPASDGGESLDVGRLDAIVCSVGGGGLFCGIVQGLDELKMDQTRVIGVETKGAESLAKAVASRELITLPAITSLATSLGPRTVCRKALEYGLRDTVSTAVFSDKEAVEACRRFANDERYLVEPACGVCFALCYSGRLSELVPTLGRDSVVVFVVCGGSNVSIDILEGYMKGLSEGGEPHDG
ncbi:serine family amino acid catabolism-related protein [Stachybotrys elegans]|uniref:L-serine ammonia-lyase n=1 Tax=Stachybotrys elegans TaxID=80388 RepID=A0A8K0WUQ1_9HYPO|nr:serine family amino acid catabolism-related protein [Stachybotrys elegans]